MEGNWPSDPFGLFSQFPEQRRPNYPVHSRTMHAFDFSSMLSEQLQRPDFQVPTGIMESNGPGQLIFAMQAAAAPHSSIGGSRPDEGTSGGPLPADEWGTPSSIEGSQTPLNSPNNPGGGDGAVPFENNPLSFMAHMQQRASSQQQGASSQQQRASSQQQRASSQQQRALQQVASQGKGRWSSQSRVFSRRTSESERSRDSGLSFKSHRSKEFVLDFKERSLLRRKRKSKNNSDSTFSSEIDLFKSPNQEPFRRRRSESEQSCVSGLSFKSDRSKDFILDFKDRSPLRTPESEQSCDSVLSSKRVRSVKSKSKDFPLNAKRSESEQSCDSDLSLKSDRSKDFILNFKKSCNLTGPKRTWQQLKIKQRNIAAKRKKAKAQKMGGGPPSAPFTQAEELDVSQSSGQPVEEGILSDSSSEPAHTQDTSAREKVSADGVISLLDSPAPPDVHVIEDDEDSLSTEGPSESAPGDCNKEEGPSTSRAQLNALPAKELHEVYMRKKIEKCDLQMAHIRLKMMKTKLEVQWLESKLKPRAAAGTRLSSTQRDHGNQLASKNYV
ncbi:uncharacterized protein LOC121953829 isoform X2 [Plectropomus leopardus]|uniref:uncharacterized protein LOC121953829 isoform X2 n=1 Tax=Plectropomus leopardus TaxID=160734 RepID=UPI001C4D814A|nr:uncharacterized protein LOC121953829 isoform X2 [Plectropomus leopardus]